MKQISFLIAFMIISTAARAAGLALGGYAQNTTGFTFADTGFFTDNAMARFEGTAGNDKYAFEAHVILSAAHQPLDPSIGFRKGSKMLGLFGELEGMIIKPLMQDSMLAGILGGGPAEDSAVSGTGGLAFMSSGGMFRYLPYTSFYPEDTFTLDRLLIKLIFKHADVYLGRQQIAWGTGYAFNPTDIWNQKNPLDVSAPKYGINALRLEIPTGELSHLDLVGVPGADIRHSSTGLRFKSNAAGFDWSVSVSRFMNADRELLGLPEHVIGGADMAGQVGEVGVWAEAAVVNYKYAFMDSYDADSTYIQADVGMDYTFENGLYVMAEYFFNGLGHADPGRYQAFDILYQYLGDMPGLARDYLMLGTRRVFLDKLDLSLFTMVNLNDGSAVLMPMADYTWSGNVSISLATSIALGDKKTSELGSLHHSASLKVTAYF